MILQYVEALRINLRRHLKDVNHDVEGRAFLARAVERYSQDFGVMEGWPAPKHRLQVRRVFLILLTRQ